MAIILNSTILEEPSQFTEGCYYEQKKTLHQILLFLATTEELEKNISVEGKNNISCSPISKRHSCPLFITTSHIYCSLVIVGTLEHQWLYKYGLLLLIKAVPCYSCAPGSGNKARLTAFDRAGTLLDPQAHERMWKSLLIKHKNGAWREPRFLILILPQVHETLVSGQNPCSTHIKSHLIFLKECYLGAELSASTFSYVHNTIQTRIHFRHFGADEVPIQVETAAKKSRKGRLRFGRAAMEE